MRTKWTSKQALAIVNLINTLGRLQIYSPYGMEIHDGCRLDIWDDCYYTTLYFEDEDEKHLPAKLG